MERKSVDEKSKNAKIDCLVLGEPGIGKTTFAGTFKGGILHFDLDRDGGYVVYDREDKTDVVEVIQKDGKSVFAQLIEHMDEIYNNIEEYSKDYTNIVFDPINAAYDDYLKWHEANINTKDGFKKWQDVADIVSEFIEAYKRLKEYFNIIVISHTAIKDTTDNFNGGASFQILPAMNETNAKKLCAKMQLIVFLGLKKEPLTGKTQRVLRCGAHPHYPTRQRIMKKANADGVDFTPHMGHFFMELQRTIKENK